MPYVYSGKTLRVGKAWVDNNQVTHPANWASAWSDADKAAKGVVWEEPSPQDAPFDSRFYWGRQADGTLIPRNLDDVAEVDENGDPVLDENGEQVITKGLRTTLKEQVNATAYGIFKETDWMYVRDAEVGEAVPQKVRWYRQGIRNNVEQIKAAIDVCGTIDDVIMLHTVPTDADGNPTGNAPINNWTDKDNPPAVVPQKVSMRQARLALDDAGLLATVESSLTGRGKIEWQTANSVERKSGLVVAMGVALALSEEQIDALFVAADAL